MQILLIPLPSSSIIQPIALLLPPAHHILIHKKLLLLPIVLIFMVFTVILPSLVSLGLLILWRVLVATSLRLYVHILDFQQLLGSCKDHTEFVALYPWSIWAALYWCHGDLLDEFILCLKDNGRRVYCRETERKSEFSVLLELKFRKYRTQSVTGRKRRQVYFLLLSINSFIFFPYHIKSFILLQYLHSLLLVSKHQFTQRNIKLQLLVSENLILKELLILLLSLSSMISQCLNLIIELFEISCFSHVLSSLLELTKHEVKDTLVETQVSISEYMAVFRLDRLGERDLL